MPFYTGDYYRDTRHLSMLQHGAYRQLLDHCWDQKGPLPLDMARCFRICGAVSKEEQDAVMSIVGEFFTRMEDGHYNRRMQVEIERAASVSSARADAAHTRWKARESIKAMDGALHDANAMQVHSNWYASGTPHPQPHPNTSEPTPKKRKTSVAANASTCPPAPQSDVPTEPVGYEVPDCPIKEIVAIYHEQCPTLSRVEVLNEFRRGLVRQRWREVCASEKYNLADGLAWWRDYFGLASKSKFLTGRTKPRNGDAPFQADFEWLVRPQNFAKVVEHRYHREPA